MRQSRSTSYAKSGQNGTFEPNPIPGGKFYRDLETGMSCTPDAFVTNPTMDPDNLFQGICQIKSVEPHVFKRAWVPDNTGGGPEAPLYVAIQAIQEATLTGASWACVGALVVGYGIDLHLIDIDLHAGIAARIRTEAADFWRRVRERDPYPPDYARDVDAIKTLYADDDGGEIDLSGNEVAAKLLARREALKLCESAGDTAAKERKTIDASIIHMLGNAARGRLADGRVIEAKTIRRAGFVVAPTAFRTVRIKGTINIAS